jgi:hypothetical protein
VYDIEYDSEVWLSFGEPWKNPFSEWNTLLHKYFVSHVHFDTVSSILYTLEFVLRKTAK